MTPKISKKQYLVLQETSGVMIDGKRPIQPVYFSTYEDARRYSFNPLKGEYSKVYKLCTKEGEI